MATTQKPVPGTYKPDTPDRAIVTYNLRFYTNYNGLRDISCFACTPCPTVARNLP